MGRKLRVGAAMACLLLLGSVTVASATSSRDNRSSNSDDRKVLVNLLASPVSTKTFPDYAPNGPEDELGTRTVFAEDLRDAKTGEAVGQHNGTCTLVRAPQVWLCHAGWTLKNIGSGGSKTGTLVAGGLLDFSGNVKPPFHVAIFGGTGDFDTVRGEVAVRPLENGDSAYDLKLFPK
jgi:hypothetical protein